MKRYEGVAVKELIKHKKRTIFTFLSIIFSMGMLILIGEINELNYRNNVLKAKYYKGNAHGKIMNINGEDGLKLQQNSLVGSIGYSYRELKTTEEKLEDNGISIRKEEIFYADSRYFNNILMEEFYRLEGRFPDNEEEVLLVNEDYEINKLGKKIKVGGIEKTIVGYLKTIDSEQISYKILGMSNVKNYSKLNASIRLIDEKNMAESIKKVGEDIGISEVIDENVIKEIPEKSVINLNINLIKALGETTKINGTVYYADKSGVILQSILIVVLAFLTYISINASVKEKRKTYSILKCIGASNGQIRKLILKEGFIIAICSIIPGMILGEFIFWCVRNSLLKVINELNIKFSYELNIKVLIIAIISIFTVVLFASLVPMIWINKLSPIEGVRQENLKGTRKKIKSKFVRKLFGYEGEIAYKNLKTDKSSLIGLTLTMIIALVVFNIFTTYYQYSIKEATKKEDVMMKDIKVVGSEKEIKEILDKYKSYGEYSQINYYNPLLRIEGLDKEIIKESQTYKYYDEEKNIIISKMYSNQVVVLNDKAFKDLIPYIDGENLSLEEFKNGGAIFFANGEEGAIYAPKNRNKIKAHINVGENRYDFENFYGENDEMGIFKVPKDEKTIVKELNVIGTIYLETLLGSKTTFEDQSSGIIISEQQAKEITSKMEQAHGEYMFEFESDGSRDQYLSKMESDLETSLSTDEPWGFYENTVNELIEKKEFLKALALVIYTILTVMIVLMILSVVNIRDIVLNGRKKEFGTMFALGMDKKMLKKSLIYEGIIQGILALIIGNTVSVGILMFMQSIIKKFTFSYEILLIGSLGIIVICMLNILNSVRRLSPKNAIDLMRNIE